MAPNPPHFTPIRECDGGEGKTPKHHRTPLRQHVAAAKRRSGSDDTAEEGGSVSWYKCRPHPRERISVVPLDNRAFTASPNKIFKSIISTLTRKSQTPPPPEAAAERWKVAVAELSHELVQATRRRDEAVLEASRLKHSMSVLEKKLTELELYCHDLKTGLDECGSNTSSYMKGQNAFRVTELFFVSVSEARSSVRLLSRSLTMQLRHMGGKVLERISVLLQPYDVRISSVQKNPTAVMFYLEALLNRAFFEDFESVGFRKSSPSPVLNPTDRCQANYASFSVLQGLTWDEVLNKGTRHFSEDFSRFCDQKMSEIVAMLGWDRAWPEPLLQAFFGASKTVWLVHLLATSVHPCIPIFRVERGFRFDPVYMEDTAGDKAGCRVPSVVRIMVSPGFHVHGSVVKCKVSCRYHSYNGNGIVDRAVSP